MKRFLYLIFLLGISMTGFSQSSSKLSTSTRFTLSEYKGQVKRGVNIKKSIAQKGMSGIRSISNVAAAESSYAEPFTINGKDVVPVWIKCTDNDYTAIENIDGVKITARFKKLLTANVPVTALEQVAALDNVEMITIATKESPNSYDARVMTNTDDVLGWTADAQSAGLLKGYDGTGVVLGVIDQGIQFDHKMFKDAYGNTRIKKAYVYDSAAGGMVEYTGDAINSLTTDYTSSSHGTHVATIAGGSDMTVSAYYYNNETERIVTNGSRTYGGMAPGTDLVLCGLGSGNNDTNIAACIKAISEYADEVGKPCIINLSLGSLRGPHDGTSVLNEVYEQYMSGAGKILFRSAGNDGGKNVYHTGLATQDAPARTILDLQNMNGYKSGDYTFNNLILNGEVVSYGRTPGVELAAKLYVVHTPTNAILWESDELTDDVTYTVNSEEASDPSYVYDDLLASCFTEFVDGAGHLSVLFGTDPYSGKKTVNTKSYYLRSLVYSSEENVYTGNVNIGLSIYPKNAGNSTIVDSWGLSSTYFTGATATHDEETYTFTAGSDACSLSDRATSPYVISVGSYNSKLKWVSARTTGARTTSVSGTIGDIAPTSSYQTADAPLGVSLPWITAPGRMVIAGFNKYYPSNSTGYLIRDYDTENPLGVNGGTSMSTPCAAGITALWLQMNPTLTINDVKELMANTAITDSYTTAAQFGAHGKIDALAGAKQLMDIMTGITNLSEPTEADKEGWFTLQGMRLSNAPTAKGVYIHNGKKVLVN